MTGNGLRKSRMALDGATETFRFSPGTSIFKTSGGKIFAISALTDEPLEVSVKCGPDRAEALRDDHESIRPGYHLDERHWITITVGRDATDGVVLELVEDSFELVA
jgi:predicted DNA-binding protein (MmcQ/YjbR family)